MSLEGQATLITWWVYKGSSSRKQQQWCPGDRCRVPEKEEDKVKVYKGLQERNLFLVIVSIPWNSKPLGPSMQHSKPEGCKISCYQESRVNIVGLTAITLVTARVKASQTLDPRATVGAEDPSTHSRA